MKRILRIGSTALALCLLLSMFVSCGSFNYMKKSLSKYIKIDAEDYIGIPVTLYSDYEVTEEKLEEALRKIKIEHRELYESKSKTTFIGYGDDAYIWYWGSYIDEKNGHEIQFESGTTMAASSSRKLTIGSGAFIDGFEQGLLGKVAQKTRRDYDTTKDREVKTDSILYVTIEHYRYTDAEGKVTTGDYSGLRVDLSNPGILGSAFASVLADSKVGATFDFGYESTAANGALSVDWNGDGTSESLALVGKINAMASKESTVEVVTTFPEDYDTESLRGKEVTFHVVIEYVDDYTLAEITPDFIKENYEDFETAETETDAIVAAFRTYISEKLAEELADNRVEDIKSKIWDYLMENTEFTGKYPKKAVKENRKSIRGQLENEYAYYNQLIYQQYGTTFSSLEEFVKLYYSLDAGTSLSDYLDMRAKEVVREELIVYSIIKQQGWDLTDEEFDEGAAKLVEEYKELYDMDEDEVFEYFGRQAIYESLLYDKLMDKLYESAQVTVDAD